MDGNGHLEAEELEHALEKAGTSHSVWLFESMKAKSRVLGIALSPSTLSEFMTFLTSSTHSHTISFKEFRDFLLLMPRKASPEEIFRYYAVRKFMGDDGRGAARVNMEGMIIPNKLRLILTAIDTCKATLVSAQKICCWEAKLTLCLLQETCNQSLSTIEQPMTTTTIWNMTTWRMRKNLPAVGSAVQQQSSSFLLVELPELASAPPRFSTRRSLSSCSFTDMYSAI